MLPIQIGIMRQNSACWNRRMREIARDAVVIRPVIESRVRVPLKHIDRALDAPNTLHRLPLRIVGRTLPLLVADQQRRPINALGGRQRYSRADTNVPPANTTNRSV